MALTEEEKRELLNEIMASSEGVTELEAVENLDGINSLPALKGEQLVSAPIALLRKPAEEAAANANKAAETANAAAANANGAVLAANTAAENAIGSAMSANSAADHAGEAARRANQAAQNYEDVAVVARNGATMRFGRIIKDTVSVLAGPCVELDHIAYFEPRGVFIAYDLSNDAYLEMWNGMEAYADDRGAPLKNKIFLCGATMYVWSDEEETLVEASGNGSGSGFYNLTIEQPLANGYYNIATALRALQIADIDDEAKPGMIMTFEVSAGKWVDYRFCGSSIDNFLNAASWEEYGGGKIKQISVNGQNVTPDAEGKVNIVIDEQEVP